MRPDASPTRHKTIRLADYRPPVYLVEDVALDVALDPHRTRVRSRIRFRLNPDRAAEDDRDLRLDGEDLTLVAARIDDAPLVEGESLLRDEAGLTVPAAALPGERFVWTAEVEIDPAANTALEGLYVSGGMFCTQCEAEGFRKITYYPDRPDVMAAFEVRVEADRETCPVLLSNGAPADAGDCGNGRHWALWRDPHPKPSYLFALVAGDLVSLDDRFRTRSGRDVDLRIFVRPGDLDKCAYAMDALKRSMRWDEEVYGLEYDLPLFMIVAVDDFNMGAMENKGLNIFNTRLVLASPETASDANFEAVESVIAHEYFHNWTGNRVTCRDWFQLCLKEGLTVFRDQQFSADERSAAVQRIKDVITLRTRQFREDSGPLAHPVRPEEYIEINNFYTATVYEKGAEVIRMLHTLLGPETYRKAIDLYFARHDGQACTIEQFAACFEAASGRDLTQFRRWWSQAGTPRLRAAFDWDPQTQEAVLTLRQHTPATPGQPDKAPLHIPVAVGFLAPDGSTLVLQGPDGTARREHLLELTEAEQRFRFTGASERPTPSLLRRFSAPVILKRESDAQERAFLLAHDADPFNRWEAGRMLALDALMTAVEALDAGTEPRIAPLYPEAIRTALERGGDPAFLALLLALPGEEELAAKRAEAGGAADPDTIHAARRLLGRAIAEDAQEALRALHDAPIPGPYSADAESAGRRALRNAALAALTRLDDPEARARAERQFAEADNMTECAAALSALTTLGGGAAERALEAFHDRWRHDPLVLDKWLATQALAPHETTLERVKALRARADIAWKNPNRFRALVGAFAGNHWRFHAADGAGYAFFAEQLEWLDRVNPQTTARMASAFEGWRRYGAQRQQMMRDAMTRLIERPDCSRDLYEMLKRILSA